MSYVDAHRDRFVLESICSVVPIQRYFTATPFGGRGVYLFGQTRNIV